ncbi:MAG: DUF3868 domain-containing protein [Tannerellaceae bacterium]|jgi:hypothetical protein|nr:DUF3868 domain-containing protein [Tannerellaceae bacterium]
MKRTLLSIVIIIALSLVSLLNAQVQQRTGGVSVKLNRAELKGNALNLDMYMTIDNIPVKRYESLVLTIALRGQGKGQILALPPVIVNGANKRQMFERAVDISGLTAAKNGAYAVLKNDTELVQYLRYGRAVAYKSWMNNCRLVLVGEFKDYRNNTTGRFTSTIARQLPVRRAAGSQTGTNTIPIPPPNYNTPQPSPNRQPAGSNNLQPAQNRQPANSATRQTTPNRQPANSATRQTTPNRQPANSATRQTTPNRQPANSATRQTTPNRQPANSATRQTTPNRRPTNSASLRTAPNRQPGSLLRGDLFCGWAV